MKLAIPTAPRPVTLLQVPGALTRVATVTVAALVALVVLWLGGTVLGRKLSLESAFLDRASEVSGQVVSVQLAPVAERPGTMGTMSALFSWEGRQISASGIEVDAQHAEGLGRGAPVGLLVDPADVAHPKDAWLVHSKEVTRWLLPLLLGLGMTLSILLIAREFRRAIQREIDPLRIGLLVWLTPDEPLPETRQETTFKATYWRNDVQFQVVARARPGRAVVRNGEKVLAALVPGRETWVRVVDEDLAKTLKWFQD